MVTQVENLPDELKKANQWVCWVCSDKVPRNPHTGGNAKSNDASTWGSCADAVDACYNYGFDGIGFMFANGYFGVDLDHCIKQKEFVNEFVETLQSYSEISKSGDGLHIICKGQLPQGSRRKGGVEMYDSGRYFICTGNIYNRNYPHVTDCTEAVKILHNKYLPPETPKVEARSYVPIELNDRDIIDKASQSRTGMLFSSLFEGNWEGKYNSHSEADIAFCNLLAFWTQKNEQQMDRIFRASGLMRDKWDERHGASTYGEKTIAKAVSDCNNVYDPVRHSDAKDISLAVFDEGWDEETPNKKVYDRTDSGNAQRLIDKFGNVLRYSYNRKKWYYWDGKMWRIDESGQIKKLSDVVCEDMKREAFLCKDSEQQSALLKWANRTAGSKAKENMIKEAQHLDNVPASPDEFDRYTHLLNCQNGVVDLQTGELKEHDPTLMMSKICISEYDASGAEPALWMSFLDDITKGNKDLQEYIQRSVGYSLTGSNQEQCAYFLYGMGNNGKSTFLDTLSDLFGNYASNAQPDTVMMRKSAGNGSYSDIARLKSSRFVTCEEPTEGMRLNEGLLKQITGGSRVTCRFLYSEEFEYTPEFKIWVATNHKPTIRGTDFGIWRRIKLIPFEVNIPAHKVDKLLRFKLRKEFPQILNWAVQGAVKWYRDKDLKEPQVVKDAVKEYKVEMDLLASFFDDCVEVDYNTDERTPAADLFQLYCKWAKVNNEYEMSSKKFFRDAKNKVPESGRNSRGSFYKCIKLTDYGRELMRGNHQYNFDDFQ